jgi:hypothetical protein
MEKLINSDSSVTQMWNPINLRDLENGDDKFSETPLRTRATWHKVPEGINNIPPLFGYGERNDIA